MQKRSSLSSLFLFSGTTLIALASGFIWIVGPGSIMEYLGPNRHLFRLIQASIGKELGSINDGDDRRMAMIKLSKNRADYVPYLISLLNNFDSRIRIDALTVLENLTFNTTDALPNIIRLLNDPDPEVRLSAIHVLGVMRGGDATKITLPILIEFLSDPTPKIRDAAINSMGCIEGAKKTDCGIPSNKWRIRG